MLDLVEASGPQAEVESRIAPLRQLRSQHHQEHAAWLRRYGRTTEFFRAIAETKHASLEKRLVTATARLEEGLQRLDDQPLSDQVRKEANQVATRIERLKGLTDAVAILDGLQKCRTMSSQIDQLRLRAEQEKQEYIDLQEQLREQSASLQRQAARIDVVLVDLGPAIEDLSSNVSQLEEGWRVARQLVAELDEQRSRLIAACQEQLGQYFQQVQAASKALRMVGLEPASSAGVEIDSRAEPQEAVEVVLSLVQICNQLEQQVAEALDRLEQKQEQTCLELEQIHLEGLDPGDRADAEQLLQELKERAWRRGQGAEKLRLIAQVQEKCELFLDRLKQEQVAATRKLEILHQRLSAFNEAQLRRFCPELTARVTGLVFGVPERPREWGPVVQQLDLAEDLLDRLELQARRLAVRDLERAARSLRRQIRSHKDDSSVARDAEALLAELDRLGPDELPPAALRMRLRNLAPSRQEE
jgi:hypothetical protein